MSDDSVWLGGLAPAGGPGQGQSDARRRRGHLSRETGRGNGCGANGTTGERRSGGSDGDGGRRTIDLREADRGGTVAGSVGGHRDGPHLWSDRAAGGAVPNAGEGGDLTVSRSMHIGHLDEDVGARRELAHGKRMTHGQVIDEGIKAARSGELDGGQRLGTWCDENGLQGGTYRHEHCSWFPAEAMPPRGRNQGERLGERCPGPGCLES